MIIREFIIASNLERLEISDYIKFSGLSLNSLDNLKGHSTLTVFLDYKIYFNSDHWSILQRKTLNIIYGGRVLDNLKNGKKIDKKDALANISQLTNFPKLETLTLPVMNSKDLKLKVC